MGVGVIRAFSAHHHAGVGFEVAVAGVGHPVRLHPRRVVGKRRGGGHCGVTLLGGVVVKLHGFLQFEGVEVTKRLLW